MVPKSRLSIPLFSAFVLVLASYVIYLVVTKNIFRLQVVDHYFNTESTFDGSQRSMSDTSPWASFFNRADKVETPNNTNVKKVIVVGDKKIKEPAAPDLATNNEPEVADQPVAAAVHDSAGVGFDANSISSAPIFYNYGISFIWEKYSKLVPPLYSAPLNKNTEEKLGRAAQLSAELDQLYIEDKAEWIRYLEVVRKDLINIAVEGEREGARALSFQYGRPPLNKTVEALAWAMIANAISPNDYYLYICSNGFPVCYESLFEQAIVQAKYDIDIYNFLDKAQSQYKK